MSFCNFILAGSVLVAQVDDISWYGLRAKDAHHAGSLRGPLIVLRPLACSSTTVWSIEKTRSTGADDGSANITTHAAWYRCQNGSRLKRVYATTLLRFHIALPPRCQCFRSNVLYVLFSTLLCGKSTLLWL